VARQAQPGWPRVDPRLADIAAQASGHLPDGWRAEVISGYRPGDPLRHGHGDAVDVQLYDENGRPLPNYQSPANFRTYEQFAQNARKVQTQLYPELNDSFQWGGYFHNGGLGHYGAADLMHLSIGDETARAGDWEHGLNAVGKNAGFDRGGAASQGMGDVNDYALAGPGQVAVVPHPSGKGLVATSLPDGAALPNLPGVVSTGSSTAPLPVGDLRIPHPPHSAGGDTAAPSWAGGDWGKLDWRAAGAPPSMAEAPPSAYAAAAADPAQRALWERASTPQGYAELAQAARGPHAPGAAPPGQAPAGEAPPAQAPPPPSPPVADIGLPAALAAPPGQGNRRFGWLPAPLADAFGAAGSAPPGPAPPGPAPPGPEPFSATGLANESAPRRLPDEDLARLEADDVAGAVTRSDLTAADRAALNRRIDEIIGQQQVSTTTGGY
jgi:hypothetical protein